MKLSEWAKSQPREIWLMIAVIAMLLIMIATRWGYTSHEAAKAFQERFTPPTEQADTTAAAPTAPALVR